MRFPTLLFLVAFFAVPSVHAATAPFTLLPLPTIDAKALSRATKPFPVGCQPSLFDPATVRLKPVKDAPHTMEASVGGRTYRMGVFRFTAGVYTVTQYSFENASNARCSDWTQVVEITKGGKRHALYTHVDGYFDVDAAGEKLLLRNRRVGKGGAWVEEVRLIDIAQKKTLARYPLEGCTATSFGGNGQLQGTFMADGANQPTVHCAWNVDGSPIAFAHPRSTPQDGRSYASFGVTADGTLFYGLEISDRRLTVVDLATPARWVRLPVATSLSLAVCSNGNEWDFSSFTFSRPSARLRARQYPQDVPIDCNDRAGAPWGPWQTAL